MAKSWRMYFEMQYTMINSLVFSRRYEYALDQADMMLAEAEKLQDYSGITKAYVIMAQIYIGTYRWHEADNVLKKAMKTMYKNDDLQMQFTVLMHSLDYNIFVQRFDRMGQTLKEIDIVMDKMLLLAPGMDITLNDHRLFVEYCHILYWSYVGDFDKAAKHEAKGKVFYDRLTYLTVSISWKNGKLVEATLLSGAGAPCEVRYGDSVLKFKTKRGARYTLKLNGDKLTVKNL